MELIEAKKLLDGIRRLNTTVQLEHKEELNEAFSCFLTSNPSKAEFEAYLNGLIFTASMLHDVWKLK